MTRTLVIFTHGAPFLNGENAFFLPELDALCGKFGHVYIVPDTIDQTQCVPRSLPCNMEIYRGFADRKRQGYRYAQFNAFLSMRWLMSLGEYKGFSELGYELARLGKVAQYKKLIIQMMEVLKLSFNSTQFYSFWMDEVAQALADLRLSGYEISFVCRAHGYDLYDERVIFRSQYFRRRLLKSVQSVFCCSRHGADYLGFRYPTYADKIKIGYLGIACDQVLEAPVPQLTQETSLLFRIVTVANLVSVKQIPQFIQVLNSCLEEASDIKVQYDIIGDGPERQEIEKILKALCSNFQITLLGRMPNDLVLERYMHVPYDLFVLPSKSEGLSMAVMEAMARGIPALVTAVGGMTELVVHKHNGYVISNRLEVEDLRNVLVSLKQGEGKNMRLAACRHIFNNFDERLTRKAFVDSL